jgi:hypothetical protein
MYTIQELSWRDWQKSQKSSVGIAGIFTLASYCPPNAYFCVDIPKFLSSYLFNASIYGGLALFHSRSQWPRGPRHELSSPASTLGSWVRIPVEAWMSVCVYSVCADLRVCSGLATGWSPVQGVLPTVWKTKKLKSGQGPKGLQSIR